MNLEFKNQLSHTLKNSNIYMYWKGRVALYALLKAMGVGDGDEVIIPAYTCVVVPNAILYLGAKPVYVDINHETYNSDPINFKGAITNKTKVIILQNTYGLSSNLEEIIYLAKQNNLFTIEDCTHGFGGEYNGHPNGTYCDSAFYSTQWNKPFSTGIGGFALVNNLKLIEQLEVVNLDLLTPSLRETASLRIQLIARKYLLNNATYWIALKLYRFLSANSVILGSSSGEEINTTRLPKNYFKSMSKTQSNAGIKALRQLEKTISRRKENGHKYTVFLKQNKKQYVAPALHTNHSFLKYPLLVTNRKKFLVLAEKNNIMLGDWFTSPIHPVKQNLQEWMFEPKNYPVATKIASKVVNLPTDINPKELKRVLNFLSDHLIEIE